MPGHPDIDDDQQQRKRYFIESVLYPGWIASVIGGAELKGRAHTYGLYAKNLQSDYMSWNPMKVTMILCHVKGRHGMIKMGRPINFLGLDSWAYPHNLTWSVDSTDKIFDGSANPETTHWLVSDEEGNTVSLEGAIDECDESIAQAGGR